jgi:hypothetical protein
MQTKVSRYSFPIYWHAGAVIESSISVVAYKMANSPISNVDGFLYERYENRSILTDETGPFTAVGYFAKGPVTWSEVDIGIVHRIAFNVF